MKQLDAMPSPNSTMLVEAANAYFDTLVREVDQPVDLRARDLDVAWQAEQARSFIGSQDLNLAAKDYQGDDVSNWASTMLNMLGLQLEDLDPKMQLLARQFVVRAKRQGMRYFLHTLEQPTRSFDADDDLFAPRSRPAAGPVYAAPQPTAVQHRASAMAQHPELSLERAIILYVEYQTQKGWGGSMRDETRRVLGWLSEVIDPSMLVEAITREHVRALRDSLLHLGKGHQGRKLPLKQRLATCREDTLAYVTRERYWRFVRTFFSYFNSEYGIPDPTDGLLFEGGKNEQRQSPAPFSTDELAKFLTTPLFAGYKSHSRRTEPGDLKRRTGYWWAAVLMMHTGMRAGDCAQLLPSDFRFDDPIPHVLIQPGKLPDGTPKQSKFGPRTHTIPLAPVLLELGLRAFVEGRAKRHAADRLLYEISLGAHRQSSGMTKFLGPYLRKFGLYSQGRATHVFRHTIAARLRAVGVSDEDSGALLGHAPGTVTGGYGGSQPLARKLDTLAKLDFGIDVLALLGGPYDAKTHSV